MTRMTLAVTLALTVIMVTSAGVAGAQEAGPCPFGLELPPQVTLVAEGEELTDFDIYDACRSVIVVEEVAGEFGLTLPTTAVYLVATPELARSRTRAIGTTAPPGRVWGSNLGGLASRTKVIVLDSVPSTRAGLSGILIHELVHVLQHPTNEANWLVEGAADYLAAVISIRYMGGPAPYSGRVQGSVARFGNFDHEMDLEELESYRRFHLLTDSGSYRMSSLAIHVLFMERDDGIDDYLSCFVPRKKAGSWRTAFSDCFEMSMSEFYRLFGEFQDGGFEELPHERRARERKEFQDLVDSCGVRAVSTGLTIRSMC